MKGKTIIELKDVKTGKLEKHVDHNMMTNALGYILQNMGIYDNNILLNSDYYNNFVTPFLGGIVAFNGTLTENADNIYPNASLKMTANGAVDVVSNDAVTELGSYNSLESGWQQDGTLKMVWDYTTTQGNGTIASVCLSTRNGGYIGFGNSQSLQTKTSKWSRPIARSGNFTNLGSDALFRILRGSIADSTISVFKYNNFIYSSEHAEEHYSRTGKLILEHKLVPITKMDMRCSRSISIKVGETEYTLPASIMTFIQNNPSVVTNNSTYCFRSDGKSYVVFCADSGSDYVRVANNGTFMLLEIADDDTMTAYTLTNTTGSEMLIGKRSSRVTGGYFYTGYGNSKDIHLINLNNSADTKVVTLPKYPRPATAKNGLIYEGGCVINVTDGACYPDSSSALSEYELAELFVDNPVMLIERGAYNQYRLSAIYDVLCTINNLESPVVKTADKTMKITYVLNFDTQEQNENEGV